MNRPSFKFAALVKTAALGLAAGLLASSPARAADPFIPLKPRLYIFGVAVEGTGYPGAMVLANTSTADLVVTDVSVVDNCHCFTATVAKLPFVVPPGGRHVIALQWGPDAGGPANIGTVLVTHSLGISSASMWGYAIPF